MNIKKDVAKCRHCKCWTIEGLTCRKSGKKLRFYDNARTCFEPSSDKYAKHIIYSNGMTAIEISVQDEKARRFSKLQKAEMRAKCSLYEISDKRRDKNGCLYCAHARNSKGDMLPEDYLRRNKFLYCTKASCPYAEEFKWYKTYDEWYKAHNHFDDLLISDNDVRWRMK